jgi:hypothetical protein
MSDPKVAAAIADVKRESAAAELAGYLRKGQLALLLGAGVSQGLGLPNWARLVELCEEACSITPDLSLDLMKRMDVVRRSRKKSGDFNELVHKALYSSMGGTQSYPDSLLQNRMLIALGALVMSSVRGSVTDVLTLNFDDVLDWYLHLHGFKTQVVTDLPTLVSASVDVRILHLHGFLPLSPRFEASEWLVLTYDDLAKRLSPSGGAWQTAISAMLQGKILVSVGTSMNDMDIDVQIRHAHELVDGKRPTGYILNREISEDQAEAMEEWGLVPVSFENYEDVPEFLLNVCQRAANDDVKGVRLSGP